MSKRWILLNLVCNLAAGIAAIVPLCFVAYVATNFPLAALDTPLRNPTENDGILPVLVVVVPIVTVTAALWWAANRWLRSAAPAIEGQWSISALATLTPTLVVFLMAVAP